MVARNNRTGLQEKRVSITTPARLDLVAIQQTVNNIRERFAQLEALTEQLNVAVRGSTGDAQVAQLTASVGAASSAVNSLTQQVAALQALVAQADLGVSPHIDQTARAALNELTKRVAALEVAP